jgi:hypothetical protein
VSLAFLKKVIWKKLYFLKNSKIQGGNKYVYNNRCISISKKKTDQWFSVEILQFVDG